MTLLVKSRATSLLLQVPQPFVPKHGKAVERAELVASLLDLAQQRRGAEALDAVCGAVGDLSFCSSFSWFLRKAREFVARCRPGHAHYEPWMDSYAASLLETDSSAADMDLARDLLCSEGLGMLALGHLMAGLCPVAPTFHCKNVLEADGDVLLRSEEVRGFVEELTRCSLLSASTRGPVVAVLRDRVRYVGLDALEEWADSTLHANLKRILLPGAGRRRLAAERLIDAVRAFVDGLRPPPHKALSPASERRMATGGADEFRIRTAEEDRARVPCRTTFFRSCFLRFFGAMKATGSTTVVTLTPRHVFELAGAGAKKKASLSRRIDIGYDDTKDRVVASFHRVTCIPPWSPLRMWIHPASGSAECLWDRGEPDDAEVLEHVMGRLQDADRLEELFQDMRMGGMPCVFCGEGLRRTPRGRAGCGCDCEARWRAALLGLVDAPREMPGMRPREAMARTENGAVLLELIAEEEEADPVEMARAMCGGRLANADRAWNDFGRVVRARGTWLPVHAGDRDEERFVDLMLLCTHFSHPHVEEAVRKQVLSYVWGFEELGALSLDTDTDKSLEDGGGSSSSSSCLRSWMERLTADMRCSSHTESDVEPPREKKRPRLMTASRIESAGGNLPGSVRNHPVSRAAS